LPELSRTSQSAGYWPETETVNAHLGGQGVEEHQLRCVPSSLENGEATRRTPRCAEGAQACRKRENGGCRGPFTLRSILSPETAIQPLVAIQSVLHQVAMYRTTKIAIQDHGKYQCVLTRGPLLPRSGANRGWELLQSQQTERRGTRSARGHLRFTHSEEVHGRADLWQGCSRSSTRYREPIRSVTESSSSCSATRDI